MNTRAGVSPLARAILNALEICFIINRYANLCLYLYLYLMLLHHNFSSTSLVRKQFITLSFAGIVSLIKR